MTQRLTYTPHAGDAAAAHAALRAIHAGTLEATAAERYALSDMIDAAQRGADMPLLWSCKAHDVIARLRGRQPRKPIIV